jgi:hypothetical protein
VRGEPTQLGDDVLSVVGVADRIVRETLRAEEG